MDRSRIKALLFIVVFLLIIAVLCSWLAGRGSSSSETAATTSTAAAVTPVIETASITPTPAPAAAATPTPIPTPKTTTATPTPTVSATAAPSATASAAATPTPVPTPVPVPTATPVPTLDPNYVSTALGSGTFESATGQAINISCDWSARTVSPTLVEVTMTAYVHAYTLRYRGASEALFMTCGDQFKAVDVPTLTNNEEGAYTAQLGSTVFYVSLAAGNEKTVSIEAAWQYAGKYSGVSIPSIECGGEITLSR